MTGNLHCFSQDVGPLPAFKAPSLKCLTHRSHTFTIRRSRSGNISAQQNFQSHPTGLKLFCWQERENVNSVFLISEVIYHLGCQCRVEILTRCHNTFVWRLPHPRSRLPQKYEEMFRHGAGRNVKWSRISSCHVFRSELAHVNDKATSWKGKWAESIWSRVDMGDDRKLPLNSCLGDETRPVINSPNEIIQSSQETAGNRVA